MGPYTKFSKLLLSFMIWTVWVQYVYCQTTDSSLGLTGTTFSDLSTFITSTTVSSNSTSQPATFSSSLSPVQTSLTASESIATPTNPIPSPTPTAKTGGSATPFTDLTPAEKGGIGAGVGIGGILVLTGLFYLCKKPKQLSSMSQDRPDTTAPEIVEVNKQN